jgi:ribosomal protein S18 acetylase RimI-like enzyme
MDTIRTATKAHADRIATLHAESWRTAYRGIYRDEFLDNDVVDDRLREWRERFAEPSLQRHVVLVEDGDDLRGFICVFGDDDPQWGSLIDNLHVAPKLKRGGIGTVLMREGARWLCKHYPASAVYLWVLEANTSARRFYEKLGARNAETVEMESRGGTVRSCRYVWSSSHALFDACNGENESARRERAPERNPRT